MRQIFESAIVPAAGKRIEIQGGEMARLKWKIARIASVAVLATVALGGCDKEAQMKEQDFVGKWHSSKANAPIRLDANGEWELLTKDGSTVQYGVWQYIDKRFVWSSRSDGLTHHEANAILSATSKEFTLREVDGGLTTFRRLD
jgi:hypothetical protein